MLFGFFKKIKFKFGFLVFMIFCSKIILLKFAEKKLLQKADFKK
jgi:hypothetical protein